MRRKFVWDIRKAERNKRKHGISFEESIEAFADEQSIEEFDNAHSQEEDRWKLTGMSHKGLLLVIYCERGITKEGDNVTRIISARLADEEEQREYELYNNL
jgi:uncharacterized protein